MKKLFALAISILAIYGALGTLDAIAAAYPPALGGTGATTAPLPGQTLIGNASGTYTPANILGAGCVTVATSSGGITVSCPTTNYVGDGSTITSTASGATTTLSVIPGVFLTPASGTAMFYPLTGNPSSYATTTIQSVLNTLSASGCLAYSTSTGAFTTTCVATSTGNWLGTWQGNNSSSFYSASNPLGFVTSSISGNLNVGGTITASSSIVANTNCYGCDTSGFANEVPNFRLAMTTAENSATSSDVKILFVGDSTTLGSGSNNNTPPNYTLGSFPTRFAQLLGKTSNIPVESGFGAVSAGLPSDTRFSYGGGWFPGVFGFGSTGSIESSGNATTSATFTPGTSTATAWNTFDVYWIGVSGYGSFTATVTGGATTTINCSTSTTGIYKTTITTPVASPNNIITFNNAGSGQLYIVGVEAYNNSVPSIRVANAGQGGTTALQWNQTTTYQSIAMINAYKPNLTFISLGINDMQGGESTTTFYNAMQGLITGAEKTGDVVLMTPPASISSTPAGIADASYVATYYQLAQADNLPLIDIYKRFGSAYNAAFMNTFDAFHPNNQGYWDWGQAVDDFVNSIAGTASGPTRFGNVALNATFNSLSTNSIGVGTTTALPLVVANADGSVIAGASPLSALLQVTEATASQPFLDLSLTGTGANTLRFYPFSDGNAYIQHTGNAIFTALGSLTPQLLIGTAGTVGINTPLPVTSSTLAVSASVSIPNAFMIQSSTSTPLFYVNSLGATTIANNLNVYPNGLSGYDVFLQDCGGVACIGSFNSTFQQFDFDGSPIDFNTRAGGAVNFGTGANLAPTTIFGSLTQSSGTVTLATTTVSDLNVSDVGSALALGSAGHIIAYGGAATCLNAGLVSTISATGATTCVSSSSEATALNLGSNAFTNTAFLPFAGGTMTGGIKGTSSTWSGNVSIGTTTAGNNLTIQASGNSTNPLMVFNSSSTSLFRIRQISNGSGQIDLYDENGNSTVELAGHGTTQSYFDAGSVTIGTSTSLGLAQLQIVSKGVGFNYIEAINSLGNQAFYIRDDSSDDTNLALFNAANSSTPMFLFSTQSGVASYINSGNKFGIGTTTPSATLGVVNGTATTTEAIGNPGIGHLCLWNGSNYTIQSFAANSITPIYATSTTCN